MGKAEKVLDQMRHNPRDWRIADLKAIARRRGVDVDQNGASHVIFRHLLTGRLSVPAHRPIKSIYVRLFAELTDKLEASR